MLDSDVKTSLNFKEFKRLVSSWDGPNCNCSYYSNNMILLGFSAHLKFTLFRLKLTFSFESRG